MSSLEFNIKRAVMAVCILLAFALGAGYMVPQRAVAPEILSAREPVVIIAPDPTYLTGVNMKLLLSDRNGRAEDGKEFYYGHVHMHAEALPESITEEPKLTLSKLAQIEVYVAIADGRLKKLFDSKCSNVKAVQAVPHQALAMLSDDMQRKYEEGEVSFFVLPVYSALGGGWAVTADDYCRGSAVFSYFSRVGAETVVATPELYWANFEGLNLKDRIARERILHEERMSEYGRDEQQLVRPFGEMQRYGIWLESEISADLSLRYQIISSDSESVRRGEEDLEGLRRVNIDRLQVVDLSEPRALSNRAIQEWYRDRLFDGNRTASLFFASLLLGIAAALAVELMVRRFSSGKM